jgi:hypothetical protein
MEVARPEMMQPTTLPMFGTTRIHFLPKLKESAVNIKFHTAIATGNELLLIGGL